MRNTLPSVAAVCCSVILAAVGCTSETSHGASGGDQDSSGMSGVSATVPAKVYDASGKLVGPVKVTRVVKSEAEWRKRLSSQQYRVVREQGTERAGTGELLKNKAGGVYQCVACNLPLFGSDSKFESGTGWPSFFRPIAKENVGEHSDTGFGMIRTEIHCARCDGHLGHVFSDGPQPTGLRYCVNSASIGFTPTRDLKKLAEPAAMTDQSSMSGNNSKQAAAVFAGGCFWCVEAVFEELDGVHDAVSGYAGGTADTANYEAVCSGRTDHAEVVRILYDPSRISYEDLLRVHFSTHDPTQLNRQGPDVGTQYRSAVFVADEKEKALATAFIADLNEQGVFDKPVVTTIEPLTKFYAAEKYHQNYVCRNPNQGYIRSIALPKVDKVRKQFKDQLKDQSPLENAGR